MHPIDMAISAFCGAQKTVQNYGTAKGLILQWRGTCTEYCVRRWLGFVERCVMVSVVTAPPEVFLRYFGSLSTQRRGKA